MASLRENIEYLISVSQNPAGQIAKIKENTGKDCIGVFPIYAPEEIVYAAGFVPMGMWGGRTEIKKADSFLQGFCCSVMKSNVEFGMSGVYDGLKAVIIPALCDTLKCIIENWKVAVSDLPMIGMVYPQQRWCGASVDFMKAEYKRVRRELEEITGTFIPEAKIEKAYELYEEYRAVMREFTDIAPAFPGVITPKVRHQLIKAGWFMDKAEYTDIMRQILDGLKASGGAGPANSDAASLGAGASDIKVVLTGLMAEPAEMLEILEENGIQVVADDLAQESRQFRVPGRKAGEALTLSDGTCVSGTERDDIWDKLAYRIMDQRGCTFLCEENKSRGDMLINMVRERKADAIIVCMTKFCDPEEFDYPVYKAEIEAAGIPMLYLELDQHMDSFEQLRTRIQSFAEML